MILKSAIRRYLNAPRDDHSWIKHVPRKELWAAINDLDPKPRISKRAFTHQLACFLLGVAHPEFSFWIDMGGGKSYLVLALLQYWWKLGRLRRGVIFVTSDKAFPTWQAQLDRWKIKVPYCFLEGSSEDKWRTLSEFADGLIFVTWPGSVSMCVKKVKKRRKMRWRLHNPLVRQFAKRLDAVVMDESTRAGHDSLTSRFIRRLRRKSTICYALAGRPFGRDPELLWRQQFLVDRGVTLGATLGLFRAAFYTAEKNPWSTSEYGMKYTFKKRMKKHLRRMLRHRSIVYGEGETVDLPKIVSVVETVRFPAQADAYYEKAVKAIIAAKGNLRETKNAFMQMRQLSSGFMGFANDETGERIKIAFEENPKFDLLLDLLEQVPDDRKAVVFYEFTYSGRKIVEAIKKQYRPIWLWSGTKDYKADFHRFLNDRRCRVAVINNRVGAYSLDGLQQVANYDFFYESPVSAIDREQAERRLRRPGQKHRVYQYDLCVEGSMDLKILAFHREAEDLMQAVMRDPKKLVK